MAAAQSWARHALPRELPRKLLMPLPTNPTPCFHPLVSGTPERPVMCGFQQLELAQALLEPPKTHSPLMRPASWSLSHTARGCQGQRNPLRHSPQGPHKPCIPPSMQQPLLLASAWHLYPVVTPAAMRIYQKTSLHTISTGKTFHTL